MSSKDERYEWTREKTYQLIKEYEKQSALWNTQLEEYRYRDKRSRAVNAISAKLNVSIPEINRKIHNLRNQVSQELQKMKKKQNYDTTERMTSKWPYFSALSFIIPTMSVKISSKPASTKGYNNSTVEQDASSNSTDALTTHEVSAQNEQRRAISKTNFLANKIPATKKGFKRKIDVTAGLEAVMENAVNLLNNSGDDYDTFGAYVAMELRSLKTERNKDRLKSEIRKAIVRIADEDMHAYHAGTTSTVTAAESFTVLEVEGEPIKP